MTKVPEVRVRELQVRGWSHPAAQRLRHALDMKSDGDGLLQREVEEVLLRGGWMSSFLPFPFTAESPEGVRLSQVLRRVKDRYPHRAIVQEFRWKFWNPADAVNDGVLFEEALVSSLHLSAEEARCWPLCA